MTDRGHVFQAGEDPLAEHPMTPEQVEALLDRARRRRGRAARFQAGQRALTADQVVAMRVARAAGARLRSLAKHYGVSLATANRIVAGQRYRDVGGPRTFRGWADEP